MKPNAKFKLLTSIELLKSIPGARHEWHSKSPFEKWCYLYNFGKAPCDWVHMPLFRETADDVHWFGYFGFTYMIVQTTLSIYTLHFYTARGQLQMGLPCTCLLGIMIGVCEQRRMYTNWIVLKMNCIFVRFSTSHFWWQWFRNRDTNYWLFLTMAENIFTKTIASKRNTTAFARSSWTKQQRVTSLKWEPFGFRIFVPSLIQLMSILLMVRKPPRLNYIGHFVSRSPMANSWQIFYYKMWLLCMP